MAVMELTDKNFEEETKKDVPIVVDFFASWCGPCQQMAPEFDKLSEKYDAKKLRFAKCSTEEFPELAGNFQVSGIPCLIVIKRGEEIDRVVGFMHKDDLKKKIDEILDKPPSLGDVKDNTK